MVPLQAMYTSPLARAEQTAAIIAKHYRIEVEAVPEFREYSAGQWEGTDFGRDR
jgi:broad specificity phosphatase PhoE